MPVKIAPAASITAIQRAILLSSPVCGLSVVPVLGLSLSLIWPPVGVSISVGGSEEVSPSFESLDGSSVVPVAGISTAFNNFYNNLNCVCYKYHL